MTKWKTFDSANLPQNWCLVRTATTDFQILARWSSSNYAWIGMDLTQILSHKDVDQYIELDYTSLNDMIYSPRAAPKAVKVYDVNNPPVYPILRKGWRKTLQNYMFTVLRQLKFS